MPLDPVLHSLQRDLPCAVCPPQIREVRLRGGDVIVSFGGAAGQELAQVITDEAALVSGMQSIDRGHSSVGN